MATPVVGLSEDDASEASSCVQAATLPVPLLHGVVLQEAGLRVAVSSVLMWEGQPWGCGRSQDAWAAVPQPQRHPVPFSRAGDKDSPLGERVWEVGSWARVSLAAPAPLQPHASPRAPPHVLRHPLFGEGVCLGSWVVDQLEDTGALGLALPAPLLSSAHRPRDSDAGTAKVDQAWALGGLPQDL